MFPLVWFSFFRCSWELFPVLQPETVFSMHFVLVKWISQEHIEERMNWFYFCKMNNAEALEWNHWKSALVWWVSPCGLWTESWMLLHHRQTPWTPWTLPPSHLSQIMEKKKRSLRCFGAPAFFSHVDHWVGVGQGQDEQLTSTLRRSHCQTRQKR